MNKKHIHYHTHMHMDKRNILRDDNSTLAYFFFSFSEHNQMIYLFRISTINMKRRFKPLLRFQTFYFTNIIYNLYSYLIEYIMYKNIYIMTKSKPQLNVHLVVL